MSILCFKTDKFPTVNFFKKVKIPNNMDGYEIFAYYQRFAHALPRNVLDNIYQKTLYVESFKYKLRGIKNKFLHAPKEYLKYLQQLIYNPEFISFENEKSIKPL